MVHILLVPAIILGLIAAHLALVVYHKHTQFPGPGRNESNVVGYPLFPVYMAKAGGFFFIVFGVIVLMGGLMQINPVWTFGPYNPAEVTAGLAARLVHGLRRGRDPDHAQLGVAHRSAPPGRGTWPSPVSGLMGLFFGLDGALPVHRGAG